MTFLAPLFLWAGLGLMAVPVVLHLVMRQRPRQLEFPALRFVRSRHQTNRRRLRLMHLLLLALRMAAIGLVALALSRPSVKLAGVWEGQEAPVAAALVFDTSPRMDYRHANRTRLQTAQSLGLWLLGQLPAESDVAVFDSRSPTGAWAVDRGAAAHRIGRLQTAARSQPLPRVVEGALRLLSESRKPRREVYVFTDLARAAWPPEGAAAMQDLVADLPDAGVYVIDVGVERPINTALGELRLSGEVLSNRSTLRLETEVSQSGPGGSRTVELYLLEPDPQHPQAARRPVKRSQQTFTLDAGPPQPLEFRVGNLGVGTHQGYVQIAGSDALGCDNERYFTVQVKPAWRILVVAPKPAEHYAVYLTQALAPEAFRLSGQARFVCDVIAEDQLAKKALEGYAAVFLLDPLPLDPAGWQRLGDYAAAGGGVCVCLGRNAQRIDAFNAPEAQALLAGKLVTQARAPDGSVYLAPTTFQHPVLRELGGVAGSIPWDAFPVFRYWQLAEPAKGAHVIVPLSDGRPAIVERPLGKGRAITMTTPISDWPQEHPWNLLPAGQAWPFLILANETATYLAGASDQRLNYYAGQTAVLALDRQTEYPSFLVTAPEDKGQVELRVSPDLDRHLLAVSATERPGNYRVQAGGSEGGVDLGFSVNLDPAQLRLDRISSKDLDDLFGPLPHRLARDRQQLVRQVTAGRAGYDLVPLAILLLAACLAVEYVTANWFYGRKTEDG